MGQWNSKRFPHSRWLPWFVYQFMIPHFKEPRTPTLPNNYSKKSIKNNKKNLTAPFYGWGSTASRIGPFQGGTLLFTTKFPEILRLIYLTLHLARGYIKNGKYRLSVVIGIILCLVVVWCSTNLVLDSFNAYSLYVAIDTRPETTHCGGLHSLTD